MGGWHCFIHMNPDVPCGFRHIALSSNGSLRIGGWKHPPLDQGRPWPWPPGHGRKLGQFGQVDRMILLMNFSSDRTLEDEVLFYQLVTISDYEKYYLLMSGSFGSFGGGAINHHIQNDIQLYQPLLSQLLVVKLPLVFMYPNILVHILFVKILKAISVQYMNSIILKSPMLRIYQMGYSYIYINIS